MSKTTKPDLLGVEPIDYVYRGSDGLIYRTIPQDVPVIETIPRYSAATIERLVKERDGAKSLAIHYSEQLAEANKCIGLLTVKDPDLKAWWETTRATDKARMEAEAKLAAVTQERNTYLSRIKELNSVLEGVEIPFNLHEQIRYLLRETP